MLDYEEIIVRPSPTVYVISPGKRAPKKSKKAQQKPAALSDRRADRAGRTYLASTSRSQSRRIYEGFADRDGALAWMKAEYAKAE